MAHFIFSRPGLALLVPFVVLLGGCGGGGSGVTVSGSVTFDGKPIEKGYINFHSQDQKGQSVGGEISGGRFTVKNVTPGKCKVEVISTPPTKTSDSMDDAIKNAKAKQEQPKDLVMPNSEGNNEVHEISSGKELNLTLKTSSSTAPTPNQPP